MGARWRADGRIVCAAMSKAEEGDTYIGDRLLYQLAVKLGILIADDNHKQNGLWHWDPKSFI